MDLYYAPGSAPCRAVQMTAKAIGIDFNEHIIQLYEKEHLKPEYVKINPQHTVPTLVDNGLVLWESRAIMIYLVEQYARTDSLYPENPKQRAIINQRLYFDMGTLYQSFGDYYYPQILAHAPADPELYKKIATAFEIFDKFLKDQKFADGGDYITLADIALAATVTTFEMVDYDFSKYGNVAQWYAKVKQVMPGFPENWAACVEVKKYLSFK